MHAHTGYMHAQGMHNRTHICFTKYLHSVSSLLGTRYQNVHLENQENCIVTDFVLLILFWYLNNDAIDILRLI